jgi:hypothetical protein
MLKFKNRKSTLHLNFYLAGEREKERKAKSFIVSAGVVGYKKTFLPLPIGDVRKREREREREVKKVLNSLHLYMKWCCSLTN